MSYVYKEFKMDKLNDLLNRVLEETDNWNLDLYVRPVQVAGGKTKRDCIESTISINRMIEGKEDVQLGPGIDEIEYMLVYGVIGVTLHGKDIEKTHKEREITYKALIYGRSVEEYCTYLEQFLDDVKAHKPLPNVESRLHQGKYWLESEER